MPFAGSILSSVCRFQITRTAICTRILGWSSRSFWMSRVCLYYKNRPSNSNYSMLDHTWALTFQKNLTTSFSHDTGTPAAVALRPSLCRTQSRQGYTPDQASDGRRRRGAIGFHYDPRREIGVHYSKYLYIICIAPLLVDQLHGSRSLILWPMKKSQEIKSRDCSVERPASSGQASGDRLYFTDTPT
jgi:hypothetical protein